MPAPQMKVTIAPSVRYGLDAVGESLDMSTAAVASLALAGLLKAGQVQRFIEVGMESDPQAAAMAQKRRERPVKRRWSTVPGSNDRTKQITRADGSPGVVPRGGASVWECGAWTLRYAGDPRQAKVRPEGNGWHLFGPGADGIFVGWTRPDAEDRAGLHIDRYEAQQTSTVSSPQDVPFGAGGGHTAPAPETLLDPEVDPDGWEDTNGV